MKNIEKQMTELKGAIVGTFNKIPKLETSHSYGWAKIWSDMINEQIDSENLAHDLVYLLHGANFTGSLNIFGGFSEKLEQSIRNLLKAKDIYSLEFKCPDYGAMLKRRKDVQDKGLCDDLSERLNDIPVITAHSLGYSHLAIGDSHTGAVAPNSCAVVKQDGATLNGQIKTDFEYIRTHLSRGNYKSLTISLGNIDIRHHIVRLDAEYEVMLKKLNKFGKSLGIPVEYAAPWPIEYEGRRIPKSGYYKGKPFWGFSGERTLVVKGWIKTMHDLGMEVVSPPQHWYDMSPKEYALAHMENGGSVHLSPKWYRRYCDWGLVHKPGTLEAFF